MPDKGARTLLIADDGIGMGAAGADRQSRHHRPFRHPRIRRGAGVGEARGAAQPDRPVRRRLLLRLHGGRPGGGDVAQGGVRGGVHLGLGRRRPVHHRAGDARDRRHRRRAAREGGCRRVPRSDPARGGGAQVGRPHHAADHHRPRRQGPAGQRRHRTVAQAARRNLRAVVQRVLPPSRPSVRHAMGHAALARRGHAGVLRAAVPARHEAVRTVRRRSRVACEAARAADVHHRQGRAAAVAGCASCRAWWTPRTCR